MLTREELAHIDRTLAAASDDRHSLAYAFYTHLFEVLPEARAVFDGSLALHVPRFMGMIQAIPLAMEMPEEMTAVLSDIGREHFRLGVREEHYKIMLDALLLALAEVAGEAWSDGAADAWRHFLTIARSDLLSGWAAARERECRLSATVA